MTEDPGPRRVPRNPDEFSSLFRIDPLEFEWVDEDSDTVHWRATYEDPGAPASPQFALHVEINRHYVPQQPDGPLDHTVWCGFHLLAPEDVDLGDDAADTATEGEADDGTEGVTAAAPAEPPDVIFRPELVGYDTHQSGLYGFTVVVDPSLHAGRRHRYKVNPPFRARSAQIQATSGTGRLRRVSDGKSEDVVARAVSKPMKGTAFDVIGMPTNGCRYTFMGAFHRA